MDVDIQVSKVTNKEMCLHIIKTFLSTLKQSSQALSKSTQEIKTNSTNLILVNITTKLLYATILSNHLQIHNMY